MAHSAFRTRSDLSNCIHRINGYNKTGFTYYPVIIVGAGESGIAMGCKLKEELGFDQFRVFERQSGIGGTWWINRYPGVACDIAAVFYSFSFAPNPRWKTLFPSGPEIHNYLQNVCDRYRVTDKIQLNTDVSVCRWLEDEEEWEIELHHLRPGMGDLSSKDRARKLKEDGEDSVWISSEIIRARIVLSAVGGLVEPRAAPDNVPGFDTFKGRYFHSARWDYDVDLKDKDVIVVGTGCSAAQFVPELSKTPFNAKSVTQLMRSPPWVVPKARAPFGEKNWAKYSPPLFIHIPGLLKLMRFYVFAVAEYDFRLFGGEAYHEKERVKVEQKLLVHMKKIVPEKYHEILTPDYGVGCKRRIFDASWFPSLSSPEVDLTTLPLTEIHEHSVTLGPGPAYSGPQNKDSKLSTEQKEIPADVIVLANGFDITRWLHPLTVLGKGGQNLVDTMQERGGPQAYQGTAMDGFPNFFIIYGPNTTTGHSSVVLASENMVQYILKFIKPILQGNVRTVEVKKDAEIEYTKDIQAKLKKTVWMSGGCGSWYYDENGWNSTLLPYNQIWFWYRCTFPKWNDWNIKYTRKGMVKRKLGQSLKLFAFTTAIIGVYKARQRGINFWEALKNIYGMANLSTARFLTIMGIDRIQQLLAIARTRLLASL